MQADPEGFIRSLDADTGPDADNPRACGVALLLCMLRKGSSHVAEAMLSYAAHLQVSDSRLCLAAHLLSVISNIFLLPVCGYQCTKLSHSAHLQAPRQQNVLCMSIFRG